MGIIRQDGMSGSSVKQSFRLCFEILLVACSAVVLLFSVAEAATTGSLRGQALDADTGEPVGWVLLVVEGGGRALSADSEGRFAFQDLPAGDHVIKTLRLGYHAARFPFTIRTGATTRLDLKLSHMPLEAEGLVVEGHTIRTISELREPEIVFSGTKLRQHLSRTIAETIDHEPGIAQRSMGPAPARPVLRGLSGDRLLVIEDGERTGDLSGSSSDHAVAIEPMTTDGIEVVRGPAALLYGSNTLGGVVNVVRGYIPAEQLERPGGTFTWQGDTVSGGLAAGLALQRPLGPFVARLDGSLRDTGDIGTPQGSLINTNVATKNASIGLGLIRSWGRAGVAGSFYNSAYGIPPDPAGGHPAGVDIDLQRQHAQARAEFRGGPAWLQRLDLHHTFSRYQHAEREASGAIGMEFGVLSHNSRALAHTRNLGPFSSGTFGLFYEYRNFAVGGFNFTPATEEYAVAVLSYQEWIRGPLKTSAALRLDGRRVEPRHTRQSRTAGAISNRDFNGLSGGLSTRYQFNRDLALGVAAMRTFRAPGVEELFSEGPHLAAYAYEVGNAALDSERGLGLEISVDYDRPTGHIHLAFFRNAIDHYIFPRNTGQPSLRRGDLLLYRMDGINALMHGLETTFDWHAHPNVALGGTFGYVRGVLTGANDANIPRLPPLQGRLALTIEPSEALTFDLALRLGADQERTGDFEEPTPGYAVFDYSAQYYRNLWGYLHTFSLTFENLTNATYRNHLNRVKKIMPEPGRNLRILHKIFF